MRPFLVLLALTACEQPTDAGTAAAKAPAAAAAPAAAPAAAGDIDDSTVVSSWNGGQLTYGELKKEIAPALIQAEVEYLTNKWQTQMGAADQIVTEKLLDAEAKKRGLGDINGLIKVEVEDKVPAPSEAEVQAFYDVMSRKMGGAPLEAVRDQVVNELMRRKKTERFQVYLEELKASMGVKTDVPFPKNMPRFTVSADDDPFLGEATAAVTIVQFAEYQCAYCGKANPTITRILDEYKGKVRMVFRDYPLPGHTGAIPAAIAANCAGEQGKYWEMHDVLMKNQQSLAETDLKAYATNLKLDLSKWETCRVDPKQAAEIQADAEAGAAVGVSGTPAFFINGIPLSGALPFEQFKLIIDRELAG